MTGEGYSPKGEILDNGKPASKDPVVESRLSAVGKFLTVAVVDNDVGNAFDK